MTVAIVDNQNLVARALVRRFARAGLEAEAIDLSDIEEGLANFNAPPRFNAAFVDFHMPRPGLEVLADISERNFNGPLAL